MLSDDIETVHVRALQDYTELDKVNDQEEAK